MSGVLKNAHLVIDTDEFKLNANRYGYKAEFVYSSDDINAQISGVRLEIRSSRHESTLLATPNFRPIRNADFSPNWEATYCLASVASQLLNMGFPSGELVDCLSSLPLMALTLPDDIKRVKVFPVEAELRVAYQVDANAYLLVVDGSDGYSEQGGEELLEDNPL